MRVARRWWMMAVVGSAAACGRGESADLIIHGGPILTVDSLDRVAEAVAIRDGKIVSVGTEAQVMGFKGKRTEVRDLKGEALLPGFVAAHEHPTINAIFGGMADVSGQTRPTNAEVWTALRDEVAKTPKGEWVFAGGLDPILTADLVVPTRTALDSIAPENPVLIISKTMHSYWANSRAFAAAGVTEATPNPGPGAIYEHDAKGQLTGFIAESRAAAPFLKALKSPLRVERRYEGVLDELLANGFTSVASLGYTIPPWLARFASYRGFRPRIRQFIYLGDEDLKYLPSRPDKSDPFFRIQGVKLWHDGSPYTGSMWLSEPYVESPLAKRLGIAPGSAGAAIIPPDTLRAQLRRYEAVGWQVAIHSQGDASTAAVVAAWSDVPVVKTNGPRRIEHAILLPDSMIPVMQRAGVSPSFHINHIRYYGDALNDAIVGPQRTQQLLPLRSAFAAGLKPTLHADSPMFPVDAFSLMQTAVLRRSSGGRVINPSQSISVQQALRAVTINAAYQLGADAEIGSIEVGKWADLQVVSASPYRVTAERLTELKVGDVYLAGRRQPARGR
jgi:predicted amidohydrolase YtcJ